MLSIGEFSRITGLTVKALRFYHEEGLLLPRQVDPATGYRHYDECQVERARTITFLREMEFPLSEIKRLLESSQEDEQIADAIRRQEAALRQRVKQYNRILRELDRFLSDERRFAGLAQSAFEIQEKILEPARVAAIRMKGCYSDCGKAFGTLGRNLGRHIGGAPFLLLYDAEYKDEDADFEACMPARGHKAIDGIPIRDLPGGRCVSLLHKGPYDHLGKSYARVLKHVKTRGLEIAMPTREIYLKGPGMIFKGNPENYLTEIQIPITDDGGTK